MSESQKRSSAKQLTVSDLIEELKKFDQTLPVWITISDDPERCYQRMESSDIEKGDIWHPEIDTDGDGPAETPGLILSARWFR